MTAYGRPPTWSTSSLLTQLRTSPRRDQNGSATRYDLSSDSNRTRVPTVAVGNCPALRAADADRRLRAGSEPARLQVASSQIDQFCMALRASFDNSTAATIAESSGGRCPPQLSASTSPPG
jgi:hypothetical protein